MIRLVFIYACVFYLSLLTVFSQDLKIKIFSKNLIDEVLLYDFNASYSIYGDSLFLLSIYPNQSIKINKSIDKLSLDVNEINIGSFSKIRIIQDSLNSSVGISVFSNKKRIGKREYKGDFELDVDKNSIQIMNEIDMPNYLSGVMLSEVGSGRNSEYYKVQVLISRTYALKNKKRHINKGFNLCDEVHCQAYYRSNFSYNKIDDAVSATKDLVIVDSSNNLIESFFHANCGGQTVEPDQVWNKKIYYLTSFKDTFCTKTRQANWEKKILKNKWLSYFQNNYFLNVNDSIINKRMLNFKQAHRKTFFMDPKYGIPLRDIRNYFSLKSTYFNCFETKDYVLLKGKGFGHGVGLCQEGAIEMAKHNYTFSEIIRYYYPGTNIIKRQRID